MGSSGSGSFGNYRPKGDRCDSPIDTDLEDILHSEYYAAHGALPAKGTPVRLRPTLLNKRLVIDETNTGLAIGNLPTKYNYLRICMEQGGAAIREQ
jgi:hypothetical protein